MLDCSEKSLIDHWYPVMRAEEAEKRHVARGQLLGEELAIWRDDDGKINVWANRCPHRGVRLSIGANQGHSLQCRYHGWVFESGSAQCIAIPAHPELKPAKAFKAQTFNALEKYGYIWVNLGTASGTPAWPLTESGNALTLRSLAMRVSAPLIAEALLSAPSLSLRAHDAFTLEGTLHEGAFEARILIVLQPMTQDLTTLHAVLINPPAQADRIALLRQSNYLLTEARGILERSGKSRLARDAPVAAAAQDYRGRIAGTLRYGVIA